MTSHLSSTHFLVAVFALSTFAACGGRRQSAPPANETSSGAEAQSEPTQTNDTSASPHAAEPSAAAKATQDSKPEQGSTDSAASPSASPEWLVQWDALLQRYVTPQGFRYQALANDADAKAKLEGVIQEIDKATPNLWSREQKLAFYINAYNAITINAVIQRWPIKSVMRVPNFFKRKKHRVAGSLLSLDILENTVIREQFREPRIHFAVNCASTSCPPLANKAYTAENLDAMLTAQTQAYVLSSVDVSACRPQCAEGNCRCTKQSFVKVSQIFEWFKSDFKFSGGVRGFLARYLEKGGDSEKATLLSNTKVRIRHSRYDWSVNAAP